MSLSEPLPFKLERVLHADGERRSYLVDENGIDEDYSALFMVSEIRNAGMSVASEEAALTAINVLYAFCAERKIDLIGRFQAGKYLSSAERRALRDFSKSNFGHDYKRAEKVVALGKGRRGFNYVVAPVARTTQFARLTHIAAFLSWLAVYQVSRLSRERAEAIAEMKDDLLRLRPSSVAKRDDVDDVEFTAADNERLHRVVELGSDMNPFVDEGLQVRNLLIIVLFRGAGIRRGELLGLMVKDFDQVNRTITVRRRQDSPEDPRVKQPNTKTRGRVIPVSKEIADLILKYIEIRRSVPGARLQRQLFVTHFGENVGQPMSLDALIDVFKRIVNADPELQHLTRHILRHFFSSELARVQQADEVGPNEAETHRRVRNYIAGRKPTSEVDAVYTQMDTKRRARAVVLEVQAKMPPVKIPTAQASKTRASRRAP